MRFFSKRFLKEKDLRLLRKGLMEPKSHRIVDFGGNWLQVSHHTKLVFVRGQGDLWEEFERLVERCKDVWIDLYSDPPVPYNYEWDKLTPRFKSYMKEQDDIYFGMVRKYVREGVSLEEYNRRLARLEKSLPDYTDDDFKRYILLGYTIPTPSYKKALDSARRAYNQINGLLKSNINHFTEFVTLTFAQKSKKEKHRDANFDYVEGTDFESVKRAFEDWRKALQRKFKGKGYDLKYICIWELQGNGNYHFHLVTNTIPSDEKKDNPEWLDYDTITRQYKKSVGLISWKHGKSDVQRISSHERISTYLSKYILKSIYNISDDEALLEKYKGQKKYFVSQGLTKPVVKYENDFEDLVGLTPYETEVVNPYNDGLIKNKIYTMLNKKDAPATEHLN